jgi:hypothetical protein
MFSSLGCAFRSRRLLSLFSLTHGPCALASSPSPPALSSLPALSDHLEMPRFCIEMPSENLYSLALSPPPHKPPSLTLPEHQWSLPLTPSITPRHRPPGRSSVPIKGEHHPHTSAHALKSFPLPPSFVVALPLCRYLSSSEALTDSSSSPSLFRPGLHRGAPEPNSARCAVHRQCTVVPGVRAVAQSTMDLTTPPVHGPMDLVHGFSHWKIISKFIKSSELCVKPPNLVVN